MDFLTNISAAKGKALEIWKLLKFNVDRWFHVSGRNSHGTFCHLLWRKY